MRMGEIEIHDYARQLLAGARAFGGRTLVRPPRRRRRCCGRRDGTILVKNSTVGSHEEWWREWRHDRRHRDRDPILARPLMASAVASGHAAAHPYWPLPVFHGAFALMLAQGKGARFASAAAASAVPLALKWSGFSAKLDVAFSLESGTPRDGSGSRSPSASMNSWSSTSSISQCARTSSCASSERNPLFEAVAAGIQEAVVRPIAASANVNSRNEDVETPLYGGGETPWGSLSPSCCARARMFRVVGSYQFGS
jgi:hypothetical protein